MFGIGFQEMLIILVVVLIFFGPKRLPDLARSLGKGIAEFKKASDEVRKGIDEAIREESDSPPGGRSAASAAPPPASPPPGAEGAGAATGAEPSREPERARDPYPPGPSAGGDGKEPGPG